MSDDRYVPLQAVYEDALEGRLGPKARALAELLGLIAGANVQLLTDGGDQLLVGVIIEEMDRVASILLGDSEQQHNNEQERNNHREV